MYHIPIEEAYNKDSPFKVAYKCDPELSNAFLNR